MSDQAKHFDENPELALGYNGKTIAVRGSYTAMIVIVTAFALFIAWMLWTAVSSVANSTIIQALNENRVISTAQHGELRKTVEDQTAVLNELRELQEEQNYMLFFASPKEKEQLQSVVRRPSRFQRWIEQERAHK